MSDLGDLVESLKREIAVPGTFDAVFPDTDDAMLEATLIDSFWEAKLDGFFGGVLGTGTEDTGVVVDDDGITTPDLSMAGGALVVIYAGVKILRNTLMQNSATATHVRYESSGQVYEKDQSAQAITSILNNLEARKRALWQFLLLTPNSGTTVTTLDGYAIRASGFYDYELMGAQLAPPWLVPLLQGP